MRTSPPNQFVFFFNLMKIFWKFEKKNKNAFQKDAYHPLFTRSPWTETLWTERPPQWMETPLGQRPPPDKDRAPPRLWTDKHIVKTLPSQTSFAGSKYMVGAQKVKLRPFIRIFHMYVRSIIDLGTDKKKFNFPTGDEREQQIL